MYTCTLKYKHAASSISCETLESFYLSKFSRITLKQGNFIFLSTVESKREICVWYACNFFCCCRCNVTCACVSLCRVSSRVFSRLYDFPCTHRVRANIFLRSDFKPNGHWIIKVQISGMLKFTSGSLE